jgi:hypothetical protein
MSVRVPKSVDGGITSGIVLDSASGSAARSIGTSGAIRSSAAAAVGRAAGSAASISIKSSMRTGGIPASRSGSVSNRRVVSAAALASAPSGSETLG